MKVFIIFSYPRSGNTLLRYIVEYFFNIKTYGYNSEIDIKPILYNINGYNSYDSNYIGIKRHSDLSLFNGNEPLIYLTRDNAIERQIEYIKKSGIDLNFEYEKSLVDINDEYFNNWKGDKIKLSYTDVLNNWENVISIIGNLIGKDPIVDLSTCNISYHKAICQKLYELEKNNK